VGGRRGGGAGGRDRRRAAAGRARRGGAGGAGGAGGGRSGRLVAACVTACVTGEPAARASGRGGCGVTPQRLRRFGAWLTATGTLVVALGAGMLAAAGAPAGAADRTQTGSSHVVQAWADASVVGTREPSDDDYATFRDLEVTVSQTRDLTHQGVVVSWSGGRPTSAGRFATNFLQVMQCWGDEASGPTPEQCQWGAPNPALSSLLGDRVGLRTLKAGEDERQAYDAAHQVPPPITNPNLKAYAMPFTPVGGTPVTDVADYFTPTSTNEITGARTGDDGTGAATFEVQTALEAPHLGCGEARGSGAARACWLVVVPRGELLADGTFAQDTPSGAIAGSPLSASNWANRMVFPLQFSAIGSSCPMGSAEQRLVGNELFSAAMTSWQPALCRTGTTFGFSQVGDDEARAQLVSTVPGASGFAVVNEPVPSEPTAGAEDPVEDTGLRYAPLAQGAIVIAFQIDRALRADSPDIGRAGTPVEDLVLNARLVAKLLTQSYRADVPGGGTTAPLTTNPRSIVNDPELVALNPELAQLVATAAPEGLLVSIGSSDAYAQLWRWIVADPFARAFLQGEPDEYGMRINPVYAALDLADDTSLDSFPKSDLSTYRQDETVPAPGYGTLDLRPYTQDMADAAVRVQRANAGAKVVWEPNKVPPSFVSSGAQLPGQRFELAVTDLTSAHRYGLRTARLVNAAGQAVGADDTSMRAAVDAMVPTPVEGVVRTDPGTRVLGAYPLTLVEYAGVAVCRADDEQRGDYASLLRYAVTTGQQRGDAKGLLPRGYLPLSERDVQRTLDLAETLEDDAQLAQLCPAEPSPAPTPTPTPTPTATPTTAPAPDPAAPAAPPAPVRPAPTSTPGSTPAPAADPDTGIAEPDAPLTGAAPLGAARLAVTGSMGLGAACALTGPVLMRRARVLAARESSH